MIITNEIQIHTGFQQDSEEWHAMRAGRIGGTSCATLLVNGKDESGLGVGAKTVLYKKVHELVTGVSVDGFSNGWTDRGTELEPIARRAYENENFINVQEVGYISVNEFLGVSPDGLVGNDGGTEFKCLSGPEHLRVIDSGMYEKKYFYQCQWAMYLTGREWWDLCFFHPAYGLTTYRQYPHEPTFKTWDKKIPLYIAEVKRVLDLVSEKKGD